MEINDGIDKLYFELASANRLAILKLLSDTTLRMQDIARSIDITPTEALRQLQRLGDAGLVERLPDSTFVTTGYGSLVLQLTSPLAFISLHREYFSNHDVAVLPRQFVNRIGDLSGASLIIDTIECLNKGQKVMMEAKQYAWGIAEGHIPELMGPIMDQKISEGLMMRMLVPETVITSDKSPTNVEIRGMQEVPFGMALSERGAVISFRFAEGRFDYAGFYGNDSIFLNWVKDLFLFYWNSTPA